MLQAINTAFSGMLASKQRLDVHANNIANMNTPGFKPDRVIQKELPNGGSFVSSVDKNFTNGPMEQTGFDTDFSLDGPGFFSIEDLEGSNNVYTRNGSFQLDSEGDLVNSNNQKVTVDAVITRIKEGDAPTIMADGWLHVDGLCIYKMNNFGVRLVPMG